MSTPEPPDWIKQLQDAFEAAKPAIEHLAHMAKAQTAMGWIYRGDIEQARRALTDLPADKLAEISVAATALSSLADELAQQP